MTGEWFGSPLAVDRGKNDERARPYHIYTSAQVHVGY
jgi:hypothetical protein